MTEPKTLDEIAEWLAGTHDADFRKIPRVRAALTEARDLGRAEERKALRDYWSDVEARSADAHAVYQAEAHRLGDVRHADAYADLPETTKEWDRVLVRWILAALDASEKESQ